MTDSAAVTVVIAIVLAIAGCSTEVTSNEWDRAVSHCKDHGGVDKVTGPTLLYYCKDGVSMEVFSR